MYRSHTCGELRMENVGNTVTLAGWVQRSRDLGGMTFVDLRDRYGITQLAFNMEVNAELCEQARKLGREFVIQATGRVIERVSKNPNIPTGEIEILVEKLTILNESQLPPFTIEDETDGGEDMGKRSSYMAEVQKYSGKLGQELRDQQDRMESDDIKYVLNMIISAVDLDKLDFDDIEEIAKKFERDEEEEGDAGGEMLSIGF